MILVFGGTTEGRMAVRILERRVKGGMYILPGARFRRWIVSAEAYMWGYGRINDD